MNRIKNILVNPKIYFVSLLFLAALSYLISTSQLGFYWDDWQAVFLYKTHSIQALMDYFQYDRPLSAFTYVPLFKILPMQPTVWQTITILFRCTAVWLLTQAFLMIWESRSWVIRWFGYLLVVFPAFSLQSVSVAFNQHFLAFLLFSASLYFMVKAIVVHSKIRWLYGGLSILTAFGHMSIMEYFIGLEALRLIIVFCVYSIKGKPASVRSRILKTVVLMIPYGAILVVYLYWRFQIYPVGLAATSIEDPNAPALLNQMKTNLIGSLETLFNLSLQDSVYLLIGGWQRPLQSQYLRIDSRFNLLSWAVGFGAAITFAFWLKRTHKGQATREKDYFHLPAALIGLIGVVLGGLPVWVTNRSALVGKWSERFTLGPMIGATLVMIVLLDWFIDDRRKKNLILTVILGLSIAFQMQATHRFANDWKIQQDYYWQIAWRIPAVEPGTGFLSGNVPSSNSSHHSVSFALNILYAANEVNPSVPVWYLRPFDINDIVENQNKGLPIHNELRNIIFNGNSSDLIGILDRPASACLLILDKAYLGNPLIDPINQNILALSNLNKIDLSAVPIQPNKDIFGREPDHSWCYYFQKADLARQKKAWGEVTRLMDEAFSLNLKAKYSVEYLPLLEAKYNLADWTGYVEISKRIVLENTGLENFVCTQWERIENSGNNPVPAGIKSELKKFVDCTPFLD